MLEVLPGDIDGICTVARGQTIHHNLLGYYGISSGERTRMARVWPPMMGEILKALSEREPHGLRSTRRPVQRIIGACVLESHLLAGMLRARKIPVRIRAGYFKDMHTNPEFTVRFWEGALRARGVQEGLFNKDPARWTRDVDAFTRKQIAVDHRVEHWICEYWNRQRGSWRLLDANNTFLKAHSNIDVPFQLPKQYFEHASEAWRKMRSDPRFNPDQYSEEPQDGRSDIRSQMLSDFLSLLNHDVAGQGEPSPDAWEFIKGETYDALSAADLAELDALADLLSTDPDVEKLVAFYQKSNTIRFEAAENDPYSFLFRG